MGYKHGRPLTYLISLLVSGWSSQFQALRASVHQPVQLIQNSIHVAAACFTDIQLPAPQLERWRDQRPPRHRNKIKRSSPATAGVLPANHQREIQRSSRQAAAPAAEHHPPERRQQTRNIRGPTVAENLSGVHPGIENGDPAKEPAQDDAGRAEAPVRDGRLLHSLQPATRPSDFDVAHRLEHVLQAEELQNGHVLRQASARAGAPS